MCQTPANLTRASRHGPARLLLRRQQYADMLRIHLVLNEAMSTFHGWCDGSRSRRRPHISSLLEATRTLQVQVMRVAIMGIDVSEEARIMIGSGNLANEVEQKGEDDDGGEVADWQPWIQDLIPEASAKTVKLVSREICDAAGGEK